MKNGAPKTIESRAVQARPNRKPARTCRQSRSWAGRRIAAATFATSSPGPGAASTWVSASGSPPRAVPTASSRHVTATTCAKNQVVPSWAAYQNTVPNPKNSVVAARIARDTRSRPRAHQARPTAIAPSPTDTSRMSVVTPQSATNGISTTQKQMVLALGRGGIDVLEVPVAQQARSVDRPGDLGPAVEEGRGLPGEMVVEAGRAGEPVGRGGDPDESGADQDRRERIEPAPAGQVARGGVRSVRHPVLPSPPLIAQEADLG